MNNRKFEIKLPGKDLVVFACHWFDMAIGASIYVTAPTFLLRYDSTRWFRCLSLHIGIFMFGADFTVPLWFEYDAGKPDSTEEISP